MSGAVEEERRTDDKRCCDAGKVLSGQAIDEAVEDEQRDVDVDELRRAGRELFLGRA